jgi:hypothetical protein
MIFKKDSQVFRRVLVECTCGCGVLEILQDKEDGAVFFNYKIDAFYSKQETPWSIIFNRLKMAWAALSGKEYSIFDIVLAPGDIHDLKQAINSIKENDSK